MNEKKKTEKYEISTDQPWNKLPPWSGLELADELSSVPRGTLRRQVVLALHLEAQQPPALTEREAEWLARMRHGQLVADAALDHWRQTRKPDVKSPWGAVVSLMASVKTPLVLQVEAGIEGVASLADEVLVGLLPHGTPLSQLTPQETWLEVKNFRDRYEGDAGLAAKLHQFMPPAVMQAVFAAHERLGEALGLTTRGPAARVIALTRVHAHLRRQIIGYVRCIAASSDDTDVESVERAASALAPVAVFRATNGRRAARARAANAEVEEDEEELEAPLDASAPPAVKEARP